MSSPVKYEAFQIKFRLSTFCFIRKINLFFLIYDPILRPPSRDVMLLSRLLCNIYNFYLENDAFRATCMRSNQQFQLFFFHISAYQKYLQIHNIEKNHFANKISHFCQLCPIIVMAIEELHDFCNNMPLSTKPFRRLLLMRC